MLDADEVVSTVRDLWSRHRDEQPDHDRAYGYVRGQYGVPAVPDGAGDELQDLAKMSVKNVLSFVRDSFSQPLSVVGFRSPTQTENAPIWLKWQEQKLDARQKGLYRASATYGTAFAVVLKDRVNIRTPRQLYAVYEDPHIDDWPVYALETWIDRSEKTSVRRGNLYDDTHVYPVTLGTIPKSVKDPDSSSGRNVRPVYDEEAAFKHGFDHPPVVRFINSRDAEDLVEGEILPLVPKQRAINAVNFDRLVVSRFGAFKQKFAIGWLPSSKEELLKASAQDVWAFDDADVKVGTFDSSPIDPYNGLLSEMVVDVAITAQLPIVSASGDISNLAAETVALVYAPYYNKLGDKRDSHGESWEQALRLLGHLNGIEVAEDAEVVWKADDARSFAQVVDGISKLSSAGVPIDALLEDVPGWGQQRIEGIRSSMRRDAGRGVLDTLRAAASQVSNGEVV